MACDFIDLFILARHHLSTHFQLHKLFRGRYRIISDKNSFGCNLIERHYLQTDKCSNSKYYPTHSGKKNHALELLPTFLNIA